MRPEAGSSLLFFCQLFGRSRKHLRVESAPSRANVVNFTNADLVSNANPTGSTPVDVGTVVVTRNPASSVADGDPIDSVIYTVSDPFFGGDIEVTVFITSTTGNNVIDFTPSRSEIPNVAAGGNLTLSGAITSAPTGSGAMFLGFSQIDFESLSSGEDTTITSGTSTLSLDSSASGDRFDLTTLFGAPVNSFTLDHVGSAGNTGRGIFVIVGFCCGVYGRPRTFKPNLAWTRDVDLVGKSPQAIAQSTQI